MMQMVLKEFVQISRLIKPLFGDDEPSEEKEDQSLFSVGSSLSYLV
jgi:hypothetical protein